MSEQVIRNGDQRARFIEKLRQCSLPVQVRVGPVKTPKSTQQINYCGHMFRRLAKANGATFEDAKHDCKLAFGIWTARTNVVTGDRAVDMKSLGAYTREDMAGFIPALECHLDEQGIEFVRSDWQAMDQGAEQ